MSDPFYGEIEIDCGICDGIGCRYCSHFGTVWVEAQPVTLDDLDEIDAQQSGLLFSEAGPLASIVSLALFCCTVLMLAPILRGFA